MMIQGAIKNDEVEGLGERENLPLWVTKKEDVGQFHSSCNQVH